MRTSHSCCPAPRKKGQTMCRHRRLCHDESRDFALLSRRERLAVMTTPTNPGDWEPERPTQYFPPQQPPQAVEYGQYVHPEVAAQTRRNPVWMILALLLVAALAVLATAGYFLGWFNVAGGGGGPVTSTYTSTVRVPPQNETPPPAPAPAAASVPAGAIPANEAARTNAPTGDYNSVWRGTEVTSEPFARAVRDVFVNNYLATNRTEDTIFVYSTVTGQTYEMTCRDHGAYIACRGGNNAVVYIS